MFLHNCGHNETTAVLMMVDDDVILIVVLACVAAVHQMIMTFAILFDDIYTPTVRDKTLLTKHQCELTPYKQNVSA
jgi:phosphotransferase system  glucose/maltose/N-acetylglucosamine-specific IIC component